MDINQIQSNIDFIESKLQEIAIELAESKSLDPSPGLKAHLKLLLQKQETFMNSLEVWKTMRKVYPNYDR